MFVPQLCSARQPTADICRYLPPKICFSLCFTLTYLFLTPQRERKRTKNPPSSVLNRPVLNSENLQRGVEGCSERLPDYTALLISVETSVNTGTYWMHTLLKTGKQRLLVGSSSLSFYPQSKSIFSSFYNSL